MIFKQIDELLSGRKTQTRRVCKPDEIVNLWRLNGDNDPTINEVVVRGRSKWVVNRTYAVVPKRGQPAVWWRKESDGIYIAPEWTGGPDFRDVAMEISGYQQLRIRITAIRQERLQDISEADARAEGVADVAAS